MENPTNKFERNVKAMLYAESRGQELIVHKLKAELKRFPSEDEAITELASSIMEDHEEEEEEKAVRVDTSQLSADDTEEEEEEEEKEPETWTIYPRAKRTFYRSILAGKRLWKRPPDDNCEQCAKHRTVNARMDVLMDATSQHRKQTTTPMTPAAAKLIDEAGGIQKITEEFRALDTTQAKKLLKHVMWRQRQRDHLKDEREVKMKPHEVMGQLDYGGFTDSNGKKVNCWSVTFIPPPVETIKQDCEHFDFFFNAANQHKEEGMEGAKKDAQAGIFFLGELFDAEKGVDGASMFQNRYPKATHVILSGDTGNGYRSYEMLEELSQFFDKYALTVELIPLAPKHAYNRTDQRIAHMNTFLRKMKKKCRVFGAEEVARAFHAVADPKTTVNPSGCDSLCYPSSYRPLISQITWL